MEGKHKVAVFDFDGTLTTRDTFLEFIKFACGRKLFWTGFLLHSPMLLLMKVGLYPNWKAKQRIFSWFFKGMEYQKFERLGEDFTHIISKFTNSETTTLLCKHIEEDNEVYVITASIEEWVRPYCKQLNVKEVLGTKVELKDGILTGQFASRNCYGKEKVNRLLTKEPSRDSYFLFAYGDSRGDKEMIEFADEGIYIQNMTI